MVNETKNSKAKAKESFDEQPLANNVPENFEEYKDQRDLEEEIQFTQDVNEISHVMQHLMKLNRALLVNYSEEKLLTVKFMK